MRQRRCRAKGQNQQHPSQAVSIFERLLWYNSSMYILAISRIEEEITMTKNDKTQAWNYALGMIKVDGLEPSVEFLELVEKEKNGEITTEDMKRVLDKKYKMKAANNG